jgi:hypothetical protein
MSRWTGRGECRRTGEGEDLLKGQKKKEKRKGKIVKYVVI